MDKITNFLDAYENAFMNGDSMNDFYNETIDIINELAFERDRLRDDLAKVKAEREEYKETLDQAYKLKDYWKLEAEQYKAEREELIAFLKTRYQSHYYCDDSWYSCPEHPDGCANDMITGCNCGAEKNNDEITNFINRLQGGKK